MMGECGSVSVVSGNVRGVTNTLPLQIELLYHDYNVVGAFVAASVLMLVALKAFASWICRGMQHSGLKPFGRRD